MITYLVCALILGFLIGLIVGFGAGAIGRNAVHHAERSSPAQAPIVKADGDDWADSDTSTSRTEARTLEPASGIAQIQPRAPRNRYAGTHSLAPLASDELRVTGDYFLVRCFDLSAGGFSFFCDEPPEFGRCVLGMGTRQEPLFMISKVIHCRPVESDEGDYLVGCKFLERIEGDRIGVLASPVDSVISD